MGSEGDTHTAAAEASVDDVFTDGSVGSGDVIIGSLAPFIFTRPIRTWSIRELLFLQAEQSVNAKIRLQLGSFPRRIGRQKN